MRPVFFNSYNEKRVNGLIKANFSVNTGKYTLVGIDSDFPAMWAGHKVMVDGKEYNVAMVYDLPRHIAIEGNADFTGKEIKFI